jgi:hypothetical protein
MYSDKAALNLDTIVMFLILRKFPKVIQFTPKWTDFRNNGTT